MMVKTQMLTKRVTSIPVIPVAVTGREELLFHNGFWFCICIMQEVRSEVKSEVIAFFRPTDTARKTDNLLDMPVFLQIFTEVLGWCTCTEVQPLRVARYIAMKCAMLISLLIFQ